MAIIENRTKQLLIVAKNSGPAIYLAPGEAADVSASEINGNAKVEKLVKSGALAIKEEKVEPAHGEAKGPRKVKSDK